MTLVDGGVYDNLGDEWAQGLADRNRRWASLNPGLNEPDELVIVNCSAAYNWHGTSSLRLPLLGEAMTLKRDVDILYDVSTTVRRRWLYERFRTRDPATPGAIVQIAQTPFHVADTFAAATDEASLRAKAVLAALGDSRAEWHAVVARSRGVKTTLNRIPVADASALLHHGYVLAMCNLHVLLDYPLLAMPAPERFEALARGAVVS